MSNNLIQKILQHFPELAQIEDLTQEDIERFMQDPKFSAKLDEVVDLMRGDEEARDHVMEPPGGVGLEQVDPNWQAALIERLQFDGDVPEFRVGRLQTEKGQRAAVPVETDSMNPMVVGKQLEDASEQVTAEAQRLLEDTETNTQRYLAALEGDEQKMLAAGIVDALVPTGETAIQQVTPRSTLPEVMAVPDPENYKAGQVAPLMKVEGQNATALAQLPKTERQQAVWRVSGTTQGRRSASNPIAKSIERKLASTYKVEIGDGEGDPVATAQWVRRLDEAGVTSPHFNPMTTAAAVLHAKLRAEADRLCLGDRELLLKVHPLNAISKRRVGWQAELRYKHDLRRLES